MGAITEDTRTRSLDYSSLKALSSMNRLVCLFWIPSVCVSSGLGLENGVGALIVSGK